MTLPGDTVKVVCEDALYEGILMPRPELLSDDIVVLKLSHGYNIGISKDRIKEIKQIKKSKPAKKVTPKLPSNKKLPTIALVTCGGTIASRIDYRSGGVYADYEAGDFVGMCPELATHANIISVHAEQIMSEDATPNDWLSIANSVAQALNNGADGVVLTHGTDTMHYTAHMLGFLLKNLTKPVVITGSQRSIDRPSSDAFMNLTCAVIAAASGKFSGVVTCMHGTGDDRFCLLTPGSKVRKMHTSKRDAFRALNTEYLGRVYPNGKMDLIGNPAPVSKGNVIVDGGFEEKTGLVLIHPGIDPAVIEHYVSTGYRGLVIAGTAFGHIPTGKKSLFDAVKKAVDSGMVVVMSSQCGYGRSNPYVYTNLRKVSLQLNVLYVEDMHPELAYAKLGWVLSKTSDVEEAKTLMMTNICGEITLRSSPYHQFLS